MANRASALITEQLISIILIDIHTNDNTVTLSKEWKKKRFCKKGLKIQNIFATFTKSMHHIE